MFVDWSKLTKTVLNMRSEEVKPMKDDKQNKGDTFTDALREKARLCMDHSVSKVLVAIADTLDELHTNQNREEK